MTHAVDQGTLDRRIGWTMLLLAVSLWLVTRHYEGIYHDARLYALQGLARLHPEGLGLDVFLRYGSQDSFTLFSPFYALLISQLGLEDAARWLTLLGQIWWFGAVGWLAVRLLGRPLGFLALAITAGLPGYYGAWEVFRFAEPFLTPRLFAEASALTSLALAVSGRIWPGALFAALGLLLHPLMGMGGALVWLTIAAPGRLRPLIAPGVILAAIAATAIAALAPVYPLSQFDAEWLALVRDRSPFVAMADWHAESWEGVLTSIVALWIFGSAARQGQARTLVLSATMVAVLGLAVSWIGSSQEVVLLMQGQAWRWTWVAGALTGIAAVHGLPLAWRSGPAGRAALICLGIGWILVSWPAVSFLLLAAVLWAIRDRVPNGLARAIQLLAIALGCVAVYLWLWSVPLGRGVDPAAALGRPGWYRANLILADGVIASVGATMLFWWLRKLRRPSAAILACGSLAVLAGVAAIPDWARADYSRVDDREISAWQRIIPEDAEVLWPEDAAASWIVLGRRNYMSLDQTAGILFSRPAAMEMLRRSRELVLVQPPSMAFGAGSEGKTWQLSTETARTTCMNSGVDFIVTKHALRLERAARPLHLRHRITGLSLPVFLYDCGRVREIVTDEFPGRYPEVIG